MSQRTAGERWNCEGCQTELVGALNPNTGKVAPITVAPHEDGNVLLHRHVENPTEVLAWTLGGACLEKARAAGVQLRRNHFMDCREAARFRPATPPTR
jgi:hypothetical protein